MEKDRFEAPCPRGKWDEDWQPADEFSLITIAHYCGSEEPRLASSCNERCHSFRVVDRSWYREAVALATELKLPFTLVMWAIGESKKISDSPEAGDLKNIAPQKRRLKQLADNLERPSKAMDQLRGIIRGEIQTSERGKEQYPWHIRRVLLNDPKLKRLFEKASKPTDAQRELAEALRDTADGMTGSHGDHRRPDWMDRVACRMKIEGHTESQCCKLIEEIDGACGTGAKEAWKAAKNTETRGPSLDKPYGLKEAAAHNTETHRDGGSS